MTIEYSLYVQDRVSRFNTDKPFQIIHISICKLVDVPASNNIYTCKVDGMEISATDFSQDLRWTVGREGDRMLKPFNLITHKFGSFDSYKFTDLRRRLNQLGIKQVMVIPLHIRKTTCIIIVNFPEANFEKHAAKFLPDLYQFILDTFDRFPKVLSWSNDRKLTPREVQVLRLSAVGLTEANIANELGISANTVRNHIENSKNKLDAKNKLHAVMIATRNHEIDILNLHEPQLRKKIA